MLAQVDAANKANHFACADALVTGHLYITESVLNYGLAQLNHGLVIHFFKYVLNGLNLSDALLDIDTTQIILNNPSMSQSNAIEYKFMTWIWLLFCL